MSFGLLVCCINKFESKSSITDISKYYAIPESKEKLNSTTDIKCNCYESIEF
jgi:hypothetical protein